MAHLIDDGARVFTGARIEGHNQYKVIRTSTDRLYTAYIRDDQKIEVFYSDNSGLNWTSDTIFSDVTSDMFSFCKSELDDIFLSYTVGTASPWTGKIKKRDHTSGLWIEVLSESISNTVGYVPKVLITYNRYLAHRLHAFWVTGAFISPYSNNRYSDDYGSSWSSITTQLLSTYGYFLSGIDSSTLNGFVVMGYYYAGTGGNRYLGYAYTNSSGGGLTVGFFIDFIADGTVSIEEAMDSNEDRWLLWNYYKGGWILQLAKNGTSMWSINYGTTETIMRGCIAIGLDGADNSYILYVKIADNKTYYRKWNKAAGSMGAETELSIGTLGYRPGIEQHSLVASTKIHTSYFGN